MPERRRARRQSRVEPADRPSEGEDPGSGQVEPRRVRHETLSRDRDVAGNRVDARLQAALARSEGSMGTSLPVVALTLLGILVAVLGLFAAGNIAVVVVGLAAIGVAGVLEVLGRRRSA
jgi:hypothetical protein